MNGPDAQPLTPRRLMFVAQRPSDFTEMRRAMDGFVAMGWSATLIYVCQTSISAEEARLFDELAERKAAGTLVDYDTYGRSVAAQAARRPERTSRGLIDSLPPRVADIARRAVRVAMAIWHATAGPVMRFARTVRVFYRNLRYFGAMMDRWQPDAIVLPEDIVGLVTPLVIKAGHVRNLPTIILPYTIANQQEAFRSLKTNAVFQRRFWPNAVAGMLFPNWVYREGDTALVRLPAPYIVGHALTGTTPPDPWMMNSGFANAIAVENEAMLDYYRAGGIPGGKLQVVGAISDDGLARRRQNKTTELELLRRELGIPGEKPLFLIGGCPDQTSNAPAGFEFDSMDDFSSKLAVALKPLRDRYDVIMRPHPNYMRMGEVMAAEGILVTTVDTARLVPLSDVYLAFGSATVRWAIACGVPTLNYDVFHYEYDDFRGVDGVQHLANFADLRRTLEMLRPGTPEMNDWIRRISASAGRWGRLDGRSMQRIAELVDGLCRLERVPRTAR